ncbi:GDP/UDP-N,N'-diacetylbacillosamine 2-epimerase (hydrolysing) [Marinobacter persicus]|uniref:GDP/UDP-N,N'-diacetylbacillosamine 2-epimerase (Hydrolysing) n=1 Tax=Marinobacter persicus TaxID=930118 RepID=A0A1I3PAJ3_9GAMM|nr:UDP-N-acetylglucosamine 2-epimerase [Marinobacter persicus]GHD46990.1 UDP-N-acetyl glucosamine 2-epimerase [Marinobacter persicus]SFJ18513.1 GDP/UDP-N,N'-diacetylbacillosamine 2-epimerase (hydrolysing) [Marinobacter persicus]
MRTVLGVTGIRSEYDIMSSVFHAIKEHPELSLQLAVTGAHLSDAYGRTVDDIRNDGFEIVDEIESLINGDQAAARVKGLGIQLQGLVQTVSRVRPDWLLVLGDREESIATALVGAYMNIPVAHVAGGDRVVGNVDDQVRHAVTKLAHLHFTTNRESSERILRLGEQEFRVFNVGNPGLDRLLQVPDLDIGTIGDRLGFSVPVDKPIVMVIQHVISTEIDDAYRQMRVTLEAVAELGLPTILSYPNSDAGGQQMIRAIREFEHLPEIHAFKNIPRLEFVNLMRRSSCLLGNSSAGILEAPLLKLPVINVGNRQKGRLHAENVQFVSHDKSQIKRAVTKACFDLDYRAYVGNCANPYGNGRSSSLIADTLAHTPIDEKLLIKDITY